MTELTFLIDLLLNHDLQKSTKDAIATRIKDVEENLIKPPSLPAFGPQLPPAVEPPYIITSSNSSQPVKFIQASSAVIPPIVNQAPSTIALMKKHGELPPETVLPEPISTAPIVTEIAQNPATAEALRKRQEMMNNALSQPNGLTKPKKFLNT